MLSKKFLSGVALTALALGFAGAANAQSTSSGIRGVVTGDDGAPVANAEVTVRHAPSGTTSTARTNARGGFFTPGLRVGGPYEISIDAEGYEPGDIIDLYLEAGEVEPLRVTLYETTELVVTGVRPTLSLNNGAGSAFSSRDISNQPAVNRDVIATLLRDPLAQSNGVGNLSVAGVNPRFNGLSIDGSLQQDDLGLGANTYATDRSPINLDAVESASIVASDYSVTASGFTGGLVNVVTRSGTNEIDGSLFYYYTDEGYRGETAFGDTNVVTAPFEETEWGVTLGGPIIRDRLFFFLSYDEYESASGSDFTVNDDTNDIDPALFDALNQIVQTNYGVDMQGRPQTAATPAISERLLGKIDWNITNEHRASFTYQHTEESGTSVSSTSFQSAWYDTPVELTAYTAQLFSDWSPNVSTTLRANFKEFARGQICRAGTDTPHLEFRLSGNDVAGTVLDGLINSGASERFLTGGCDRFRHANLYDDSRLQLFASADFTFGDHVLTIGGELQQFELFNLFVERSSGAFIFDNVTEIETGQGVRVEYINDVSNDANNAASDWGYDTWVAFAQDSWQITPRLAVDFGLRYERYVSDDLTPVDNAVAAEYGFNPVNSLDGLDLFMPRISFRWDATDRTRVTGGFGLFAGGNPNVWFSNAYAPGVVSANIDPIDITSLDIPASLQAAVAAGTPRIIDVIDPDFEIPSDWKASLRIDHEFDLDFGGFDLGDNYLATAQILFTDSRDGFLWRNLAQTELPAALPTGVAPDGRTIYADLQALGTPNLTMLTNGDGGESTVISFSLAKEFDFGFDFNVGYAYQDVNAISEGTSSRGISSWRGITATDRNFPSSRTSPFQVEHTFRISLGYENEFISDLTSRFDLFGQISSGSPFTFTYDINNDNSLFGRAGNGESPFDNNPLYIPTEGGDPLVVYGSGFDQAAFFDYVGRYDIPQGQIHEVNSAYSAWNQRWDFRFQQELPGIPGLSNVVGRNRLKFVLDIQNVLNLINDDWGTMYNGPGNNQLGIVQADLISRTDPNYISGNYDAATALTLDAARTTCTTANACVYRYRDFDNDPTSFRDNPDSVFAIRVGLRYEF